MVLIEIAPLLFIGQFRSQCCPSINADIAVFDSDIDIDFATSKGVTPSAKSRLWPSGKVKYILLIKQSPR